MRFFDVTMDVEDSNLASLRECVGDLVCNYLLSMLPHNSIWLTNGQIEDLNVAVRGIVKEKFGERQITTADQLILIPALLPVANWLMNLQHFQRPTRN